MLAAEQDPWISPLSWQTPEELCRAPRTYTSEIKAAAVYF